MTRQEGTVPGVVDVTAHVRTLVNTQVGAHSVQVVAVTITREVVRDGAPAICKLFNRLCQPSVREAEIVCGIAVEDATQTTGNVVV